MVKCVQKYFSYITDEIVSLRRNFSKALVILSWFLLLFLFIIFINSIYQPCIPSWSFSKWALSRLFRINIWIFGNSMVFQYRASGLGTNRISYKIFDLRHVSKVAAHFQKKNRMFIYSFKYPNEEYFKNKAVEPYLKPCQISIMERFCIIDVWYGSKYTPEVAQNSKINLKWMNTKMLEKTVHFFNVDLVEDIPRQGYPRYEKR